MTNKYSLIKVKRMVEQIWRSHGDRFNGYTFVDALNTDDVTFRCNVGHIGKTRIPAIRIGKRCRECHGAIKNTVETITERVLQTWRYDARFLGKLIILYVEVSSQIFN